MTNPRLPVFSIAMTSALALCYEVLLMKLFSIIQWHHFAYMIISLALLGYGASGTFLALARERLLNNFSRVYIANILFFGLSALFGFILAQQVPFNPLEIFWDTGQTLWLFFVYIVLMLPFFFAANAVGLALSFHDADISRLYSADLLGAGIGSFAVLMLLNLFFPITILQLIGTAGLLTAAVASRELNIRPKALTALLLLASLFSFALPDKLTGLKLSEYKDLSQALRIKGAKTIDELSSVYGMLSVVENKEVPFRYVPGLSIISSLEPPSQLGVFTNGDGISMIAKYPQSIKELEYIDYQTSSLAYRLNKQDRVLIIGTGGGAEVLQALYYKAEEIDAVELNPQMIDLVGKKYAEYAGNIYSSQNVTLHAAEARGFLASSKEKFDLIQMAMIDSFGVAAAALHSLSENYLYTVEAFEKYMEHLKPDGYISITRWLKLPPQDIMKLVLTAVEAMKKKEVENPAERLVLIRGMNTTTLVIKNGSFSSKEIESLDRFCEKRFFDKVYHYGMKEKEANRYNIIEKPLFFQGIKALLEDERGFIENYKFDIRAATDDRPYFYHFFKWETLPEILSLRSRGGMHLLEWGYLLLIAALLQAVVASLILILLPLLKYTKVEKEKIKTGKRRVLVYFFSLGFGFMFIEIFFIQRFILFLSHPIYTVAVVLSSFLIFAGLGSAYSKRAARSKGYKKSARYAILGIFVLGIFYSFALDDIFEHLIMMEEFAKIIFSVVIIAPLAFVMGIPFPMGLCELGRHSPSVIPWAWGVNGCASVISAIAATLFAIHLGFAAVMLSALVFYLIAHISFPLLKHD